VGTVRTIVGLPGNTWQCVTNLSNGEFRGATSRCFKTALGLATVIPIVRVGSLGVRTGLALAQGRLAAEDVVVTGGRSVSKWRWGASGVSDAEAEQAYAAIRASPTDVQAIARYQGLNERSVTRLRAMKQYLFTNPRWSEADPEIANAWHRLRTGQGTAADMTF
jgi:hypothetical protein